MLCKYNNDAIVISNTISAFKSFNLDFFMEL